MLRRSLAFILALMMAFITPITVFAENTVQKEETFIEEEVFEKEESEKEILRNQGLAVPEFTRQADRLETQERVGVVLDLKGV